MDKKVYIFKGIVKYFDKTISYNYSDETTAISPKQALNNICYKYKRNLGYKPNAKITLHGSLILQGENTNDFKL